MVLLVQKCPFLKPLETGTVGKVIFFAVSIMYHVFSTISTWSQRPDEHSIDPQSVPASSA